MSVTQYAGAAIYTGACIAISYNAVTSISSDMNDGIVRDIQSLREMRTRYEESRAYFVGTVVEKNYADMVELTDVQIAVREQWKTLGFLRNVFSSKYHMYDAVVNIERGAHERLRDRNRNLTTHT
jgi:hypothetical protein